MNKQEYYKLSLVKLTSIIKIKIGNTMSLNNFKISNCFQF